MATDTTRTVPMFLGFGDYDNNFAAMFYRNKDLVALDDVTLPDYTSQPHLDELAYIDKHAQPSHHTETPEIMKEFHGKITGELAAKEIPSRIKSGDVHAAIYDFANEQTYVSHGITDEKGDYIKNAW